MKGRPKPVQPQMPDHPCTQERVRTDGKFFRLGQDKFYVKGFCYGPFNSNSAGEPFPSAEQAGRDFALIRQLGGNCLRIYYPPPAWFLDLALENELRLLVDIPWNKHLCFLDQPSTRLEATETVRKAAALCARHPALFAISVVNEIPPDIVRWNGRERTGRFIDLLVDAVKEIAPDCLCTFGNFPPTEFLHCRNLDFHCFNVYLHEQRPLRNYLARLQMIAEAKPLLLGEFGIDSIGEGEEAQARILEWQIQSSFQSGLAGTILFSFTDEWFAGGFPVSGWAFGITAADRRPKPSFAQVQRAFQVAPYFPPKRWPRVSVVVASFNGARTLPVCLDSLHRLNYPDYEVILVDDGSTDGTAGIAASFPKTRCLHHETNQGLSVARNTGIAASDGEIIAFTDADCRADEDWLYYLVSDLLEHGFAGMGGPNLLPPEDSWVAAAVMVSPGGPSHVMITDRVAEHIPGCNMAFYKSALAEAGCFDPIYTKAGDDVDICWRLQQLGCQIGFSPSAFVWHYRRATIRDYLKQQYGYGEAEALLVHRHPEYFNLFGGNQWRGRIYSPGNYGVLTRPPMVYHGAFASSYFQTLYSPPPSSALMLVTSLEYYVFAGLPLVVLSVIFQPVVPLAITAFLFPLLACAVAAAQADIPRPRRRFWSRPLIALLFFLQPIVRGWARYKGRLNIPERGLAELENLDSLTLESRRQRVDQVQYYSENNLTRVDFLRAVIRKLDEQHWPNKTDAGWNDFDLEVYGSRWTQLQLLTVSENHGANRSLIRCRLRPAWSLSSRLAFWSACALIILLLGFWGAQYPWLALLLGALPLFIIALEKEQTRLQRILAAFLDDTAATLGFIKLNIDQTTPSHPVSQPASAEDPAKPPLPNPPPVEFENLKS
jgi:O-antigen biosynthesis protein